MWVVLKYKNNELNILKEDLKKKLGQQLKIYQPKIKLQRLIMRLILSVKSNVLFQPVLHRRNSSKFFDYLHNIRIINTSNIYLLNR